MAVYKRGNVYWYEFQFLGQRVRDSAHTSNRELARSIERNRRRTMEESAGGVKKVKPIQFRKGSKKWLEGNAHWSESTREINDKGHSGMNVSQDAGAVLAHAQSSQARRGQQTPSQEAEVVPFTPGALLGSPKIPHSPKLRKGCQVGNPFFFYGRQGGV